MTYLTELNRARQLAGMQPLSEAQAQKLTEADADVTFTWVISTVDAEEDGGSEEEIIADFKKSGLKAIHDGEASWDVLRASADQYKVTGSLANQRKMFFKMNDGATEEDWDTFVKRKGDV